MSHLQQLGFSLIPNFITVEEETNLLQKIDKKSTRITKTRNSIQRFGSNIAYKGLIVSNKIPENFQFLLDRLLEQNLLDTRPDSITINEYKKGQAINPHIDNEASGKIISVLSLMHEANMIFHNKDIQLIVHLPPRSLFQIRNEIRTDWEHSLEPVTSTRYSIVFRCCIK